MIAHWTYVASELFRLVAYCTLTFGCLVVIFIVVAGILQAIKDYKKGE